MQLKELDAADVNARLARGEILLIDVREPAEFSGERIAGAISFPLSTFDAAKLPEAGGKSIVFHCGIGKRSMRALNLCQQAGLDLDTHLAGGLQAWKAAGLPTVSG
jgi:rhodanese-related sulfurtransferase